jgi:plasmid stabilization system protein ParE
MVRRLARISPEAAAWLLAEIRYLAGRSPSKAVAVVAKMRAARENLADYPLLGSQGLLPDTRRLVVGAYVLTVRTRDGLIEVVAIRHGRQADADAPVGIGDDG